MAEEVVPFSDLLAGYGTTTLGDGMGVESVFALLKLRGEDGSPSWSVRSGGAPLTKEELLGVLDGLTTSIRHRLTNSWKGTSNPSSRAAPRPPEPVQFSELLSGLDTLPVADEYLIESVFAVIKARRIDGSPAWHVRSSEMKMSSQEQVGALDGYVAAIRQELADSWNW